IVVGIAMLMPIIAYFAARGAMNEAYAKGEAEIKAADSDVKKYVSGTFPNNDYQALTDNRTAALSKDVWVAWGDLYKQQAPLLTWPPEVEERFKEWGTTKWPQLANGDPVDDAAVRNA